MADHWYYCFKRYPSTYCLCNVVVLVKQLKIRITTFKKANIYKIGKKHTHTHGKYNMLVKAYRKVQCLSENLPKSAMFEWKLTGKCNMLVKTYRKVQCLSENLPERAMFEGKLTGKCNVWVKTYRKVQCLSENLSQSAIC